MNNNNNQRVCYRKVRNLFRISSEGRVHVVPAPLWNDFLKRYGKRIDVLMENEAGRISVDREAFNKMIHSHLRNTTINYEVVELIKFLSKQITDINYDAPADDYLKQVNQKVEKLQNRLKFFQRNEDNDVQHKPLMDWTV